MTESGGMTLVWGATQWLPLAAGAAALLLVLLAWGYSRARVSTGTRAAAVAIKLVGVGVLALCLLEPLFSGTRARPGANLFVVLTDNSQSMTLKDRGADQSRGDQVKALAAKDKPWLTRLGQDFDVRQHSFDAQVRPLTSADELTFDGKSSNLAASLDRIVRRYQGRPLAGVLLVSDGTATDADAVEKIVAAAAAQKAGLPPVYPLVIGGDDAGDDVRLGRVSVTQTNFEDAPVTVTAQVAASGFAGKSVLAELVDEVGKVVEKQKVTLASTSSAEPSTVRFRIKPEKVGVSFYRVRVAPEDKSPEATVANNERLVTVDRGKGPYRVLYVGGRPNWEYKFLSRAVAQDDQVQLVALMRIARREPKFVFRARNDGDNRTNPLFQGFDNKDKDQVEQYDQPVLVRMGTQDEAELRSGFPKSAEELFKYHAIVLDDVESDFFTQDQMQLMKEFVRQRGGGLLMLGGTESFHNGKFDRTPIGDLLPVYADQVPPTPEGAKFRVALTREGWLEPWVRLRPDEDAERQRLAQTPPFFTVNQVRGIKPGATILARADMSGPAGSSSVPALVEQPFGQGRVGALLIADLWRWGIRRPDNGPDDMGKAWRQTVRWLVADVPKRVDVALTPAAGDDDPEGAVRVTATLRDESYAPLDNAAVTVRVTGPDGKSLDLRAEPSSKKSGTYEALYVPRQSGAYRARVTASAADASIVGESDAGWTSDPAAEEFADLRPNRQLLDRLATATAGQSVNPADLDAFVASLPTRKAQVTEPYIRPVWHQPWVYLLAIACLTAEWGLRRLKGLP